jgi:hypothetical protein
MKGYWVFDEYEDDYVYVPSAEELADTPRTVPQEAFDLMMDKTGIMASFDRMKIR